MDWLQKQIDEGKRILDEYDIEKAKSYVRKTVGLLAEDIPTVKQGLCLYRARVNGRPAYTWSGNKEDIELLIDKMNRLKSEKESAEKHRDNAPQFVVNSVNNNSSTSHSSSESISSIEASFSFAYERVNGLEGLSDDEKAQIIAALKDIENSSGIEREGKIMRCLKTVADKSFDVFKAIAPAITQAALGQL